MDQSHSVLSDGHVYNSPRSVDPSNTRTLNHKLKHPTILQQSKDPQHVDLSDLEENISIPAAKYSMERTFTEPGPSRSAVDAASIYLAPLIRTLDESLKDLGTHSISTYDLVEAYNMLSTKIRDFNRDFTAHPNSAAPSFFSKDQSTTIFHSLMRDIGRVLPNPFESQRQDHSFADLSFNSVDEDDVFQLMTENSLLCQYALRHAADILAFPSLHCNFTEDQLVPLLRDILSLCTIKDSATTSMEKHVATVLWTLKVQQLPLSTLTSVETSITSALSSSLNENTGGRAGKVDALKAISVILEKHSTCITWLKKLMPSILNHLNSDDPELAINAALAFARFATAKMDNSSISHFPDPQIVKDIRTYVYRETSQKASSQPDNVLLSYFKGALRNDSQWNGTGPSFAMTILSTFIVLLDRSLFDIPDCLKFIFFSLRECGASKLKSVHIAQREVWRAVFWAFSRIPRSSDIDVNKTAKTKPKTKKGKAFAVVMQDLRENRRLDLLSFLLNPDDLDAEPYRSEKDVSRAIFLVADLVEKGGSTLSRVEGVAILSRMLASIGSSSFATWRRGPDELAFARQLIDGSFLLQSAPELIVPPTNVLIERLSPLTETEVLEHWDELREIWASIVQKVLDSGYDLSPEIQHIWQALLLVNAVVGPGQRLISGSSSFSSTVVSVIEGFSATLDTVDMQICYLSCIKHLWWVMKNVFTESWLCSPGEGILASLLKRQFTLSDSNVKELWSQLCADLIFFGAPGFLRVLHLRSENHEEEEEDATKLLWFVLAKNHSLVTDEEDSEALVRFLLMPIDAWFMSSSDYDLWERVFDQLVKLANKEGRTNYDVVSQFLSLCTKPKLNSLKQSPRTLCYLLSQSTLSSPVSSPTNLEILSWIDDSLYNAYGTTAEKSWALDSLRLIGEVISKTGESDIVKLLCVLQKSLIQWIGDEERQLDDYESEEIVDMLYTRSLDILSRVEPSITILQDLTPLLRSVFIRVRGQGALVFFHFWRNTYHNREDVPKNEYPLLLRQCLKAWADVTANSFGDGFSLDSGSQSIQSYTIPDSQLSALEDADMERTDFDLEQPLNEDAALLITAHDYSGESTSRGGATTPVARQRPSPRLALAALQDYSSHTSGDDSPSRSIIFGNSLKRPADSEIPRTPKRPRKEVSGIDFASRVGKGKARADDFDFPTASHWKSASKASISEPVTRLPSLSILPLKSSSQPSRPQRTNSSTATARQRTKRFHSPAIDRESPSPGASSSDIYRSPREDGERSAEDYDAWEQPVSSQDLEWARARLHVDPDLVVPDSKELRVAQQRNEDEKTEKSQARFRVLSDLIVPDSEELRAAEQSNRDDDDEKPDTLRSNFRVPSDEDFIVPDSEELREAERRDEDEKTDNLDSDDQDILSPSLGEYAFRSRARERSQTAPEQHTSTFTPPSPTRPLRRNRTTPVESRHSKTLSAQLDVLQQAYAVVADTGASQVDIQDIMAAKRLLNQINQALDEQMCSKLGSSAAVVDKGKGKRKAV